MKTLSLVLSVAIFASSAQAGGLMRDERGNHVRTYDTPCTTKAGVFAELPDVLRPKFKAAEVLWDGKKYDACWTDLDPANVYVIDEAGDAGAIPRVRLVPEVGA